MNDPFGIKRLLIKWQHNLIGDDVIDEVGPHCPGKSQIIDLDRRWAMRQDARAAVLRVALEIDRDIDLESTQELRNLGVAFRSHVKELIERRDQPRAHLAAVVRAE